MRIRKIEKLAGNLKLPGDKSISHRAAILSAIAEGRSEIRNFSSSADCASTLRCIEMLGAKVDRDGDRVIIEGRGDRGLIMPEGELDCGNSGTTMRLLAGILAGQPFKSVLCGDESLSRRPMLRIIEPLERMGAKIEATDNHPPLQISGQRPLSSIDYVLPVASAQVKSAVLLAGLFAAGRTTVIETIPTRDHTERMLPIFGAQIESTVSDGARRISVSGGGLKAASINVPADISSAAFFLVGAICLPGSELYIENVGLNPTRTAILDVLESTGGKISIEGRRLEGGEPVGSLRVSGGLKAAKTNQTLRLSGKIIANLIDEVPILAVLGTQLHEGIEIREARELRYKESDRIDAVCKGLRAMGAAVEEFDDGLRIYHSNLLGARIDARGDHRIAMAFAIAGLLADGETVIDGAESAAVSFPDFFDCLQKLSHPQPEHQTSQYA